MFPGSSFSIVTNLRESSYTVDIHEPPMPSWVFDLLQYLALSGLSSSPIEEILGRFSTTIRENGIPLSRTATGNFIIHPLYCARVHEWSEETQSVHSEYLDRWAFQSEKMQNSPFFHMRTHQIPLLHYALADLTDVLPFPILTSLRDDGYTDYVGVFYSYGTQGLTVSLNNDRSIISEGFAGSFTTKKEGGFSKQHIEILRTLSPHLGLAIRTKQLIEISSAVATTYLGKRTAQRVLSGEIDRGAIDNINAIIWYGDLKGFTQANDSITSESLIPILNEYLELISKPIIDEGGEILKYIGDGILAIFELSESPKDIALAALRAAQNVMNSITTHNQNEKKRRTFDFDLVLHTGIVSYGNIGAKERLDFTVIGPAVNEASRMESLCDNYKTNLILSKEFVELSQLSSEEVVQIGKSNLRGVKEQKELYTLPIKNHT